MPRCRPAARLVAVTAITVALSACALDLASATNLDGLTFIRVSLVEVGGSGVTGYGLSYVSGTAKDFEIAIQLSNTVVGRQYDGHVHRGTSCPNLAEVVQSIPSAVGRAADQGQASTANFRLPLSFVSNGYYVDFHTTVDGVERRVACGLIEY